MRTHDNAAVLVRALDRARQDARLLASILLMLAAAALGLSLIDGMTRSEMLAIRLGTGLCLLLPGTAFAVVFLALRARQAWAVRLGVAAAIGHLLIGVGWLALMSWQGISAGVIPAGLTVFFVPASLSYLFHTRKARIAARALEPTQGFAPLISSAEPVTLTPADAVAVESVSQGEVTDPQDEDDDWPPSAALR